MKRTGFVLLLILVAANMFAARLMNQPVTITQPNGTELNVLASGDEFHNWLHDDKNFTIIQHPETGWYTWAVKIGDELSASEYKVCQTNPQALNLQAGLNISPQQKREKYELARLMHPVRTGSRAPHFGTINNLVVFIKFSDSPNFTQNITYYDNMFNNDTANYNSMRNYFRAVSYNQLNIISHFYPIPSGTTILCYTDPHPRAYYMPYSASNPIGYDTSNLNDRMLRQFTLLTNAVNFISAQVPTSLDLDGNDDGDVDNVCFIVQGGPTAWATLLWPHRWVILNSTAFINGIRVYDFNFQLENFLGTSGASVLCHEMAHTLGAPDLYRYEDNTIDPIGTWDLMSANTNPPQSMSAWMKHRYLSWVPTVPTLTQSGTYTINSVWSQTNNIYRIPTWRSNEFYVIEYRRPFGIYDRNIPGSGLLIYRLNINENGNAQGPPDELYIYRPAGISNTINGHLNMANFSQQTGRTFLNETTSPNGFLSNGAPGGLDISGISASGGETMTFTVNISNVQVTFPKGGETFFGGVSKVITWRARNQIGNAKIEFSSDNGQNWQTVTASTPNTGSFTWNSLPMLDSNRCLIRVTTMSNNAVDVCNGPFSIISTIATPNPLFPTHLMVNAPTNPTFRWNSVPGAVSYTLQVALDSNFVNNIINLIDLPDTTYTYNNLMPFTTYFWQVAAFAPVGLSNACPAQQFTTGQISIIPIVPQLVSPVNNSTNQPLNPVLRWNSANYASHYHFQVATDAFFTNIVQQADNLTTLEYLLQPLAANTRYFWRVRSWNTAGYSNFGNIRNFTTGTTLTASEDDVIVPMSVLKQNYPNPFSKNTSIDFSVKDLSQNARLTVYNIKGQVIRVLFDGIAKDAVNRAEWDGKDDRGKAVADGVYYYKLESGSFSQIKKMLLMR